MRTGSILVLALLFLAGLRASAASDPGVEFTGIVVSDGVTRLALTEKATSLTQWVEKGGEFWIGVSAEHREASGLRAGDEVDVTLVLDTAPREVEVPPELAAALDAAPDAKAFFDGLSYSNKRVFTLSVEGTSNPETKARRVDKAIALMREGRVR